ncbi:hypothetical protein CPE01_14200 [Cellulomonas persica]|uniref:Uncharacterized protein n=1 Tax=Cellulomonas persica TaxID=76861 RepID=A0A510USN5_9CELL|nr:hypothetical protein CPE01_14200 [Cellulomonas persica]
MPCVRSAYVPSQGSSRVPAAEDVGVPDVSGRGMGSEVISAVWHSATAAPDRFPAIGDGRRRALRR